jgi:hypothetical protein
MAETKRQAYRNTRTDAIRQSSKVLGYPYVPATESKGKGDAKNGGDAGDSKG